MAANHTANQAAKKNYQASATLIMLGLAFICLGLAAYLWHHTPTGWETYALAVLPTFPIVALVIVVGRQLAEETDEFQRDQKVRSILWGTGAVLAWSAYSSVLRSFGGVGHTAMPFGEIGIFCWVMLLARWLYSRSNKVSDVE